MTAIASFARLLSLTAAGILVTVSANASAPPPPQGSYKVDPARSGAFAQLVIKGGTQMVKCD